MVVYKLFPDITERNILLNPGLKLFPDITERTILLNPGNKLFPDITGRTVLINPGNKLFPDITGRTVLPKTDYKLFPDITGRTVLPKTDYKLFPDISERTILTQTKYKLFPDITERFSVKPPLSVPKVTLKEAFTELFGVIAQLSSPTATVQEIVSKLQNPHFETLKKVGYFIPAATALAVETGVKLPAGAVYFIYNNRQYIADKTLNPLIDFAKTNLNKVMLKQSFNSLYAAIQKAFSSKTPGDKYEKVFNNLKQEIRNNLTKNGYDQTSEAFTSLVDSIGDAIQEKKRCDEKEFLETLKSGTDRNSLKLKLEGLLKRLDLNSEDEYQKFQNKVVETLTNQFSLFSKFQQKVVDELYKIGIQQIKEVEPDFFQILNDDSTEVSEHKNNILEMQQIYKDEDEDEDRYKI
jgi:hypothetical protein